MEKDKTMRIPVNNGIMLRVELDNEKQEVVVFEDYDKLLTEITTRITAADFISMLNWYYYQKRIGNKDLMF